MEPPRTHEPFTELQEILAREPRQRRAWALWLFALPFIAVLVPELFNFVHPKAFGLPFFVWYQLLAVIFGAVVAGAIYRLRGAETSLDP